MLLRVILKHHSKDIFDKIKGEKGVNNDLELNAEDMIEVTEKFKANYKELSGEDFSLKEPKSSINGSCQGCL